MSNINKRISDEKSGKLYDEGQRYQQQGYYEQAISRYNEILDRFPTSYWAPYAQYAKASCYYKWKDDYKRAAIEWKKVSDNYPKSECAPHALYHLGECYEKLQQWDRAYEAYKDLMEKYPHSMYVEGELRQFIQSKLKKIERFKGLKKSKK
jgi:TolA-binding protein